MRLLEMATRSHVLVVRAPHTDEAPRSPRSQGSDFAADRDTFYSSLPTLQRSMAYVRCSRPEPNRPTKPITIK